MLRLLIVCSNLRPEVSSNSVVYNRSYTQKNKVKQVRRFSEENTVDDAVYSL